MKKTLLLPVALIFIFAVFVSCASNENINIPTENQNATIVVIETPIEISAPVNIPASVPEVDAPRYFITLDINPTDRLVVGVERVDFTNNTDSPLNEIFFNVPFAAFSQGFADSENGEAPPYFARFANRIFRNVQSDQDDQNTEYSVNSHGWINITSATVNMNPVEFSQDGIWLAIHLNEELNPGMGIEIGLGFEAFVPKLNHRTGGNENAMWFGNFLPTLAVYDNIGAILYPYYPAGFPFFTAIANYTVEITTPPGTFIATTGISTVNETDNRQTTRIDARMVRDFAFVVMDSQYSIRTATSPSGVIVNFYYLPDCSQEDYNSEIIDNVLYSAIEALEYFINHIGSYPYQTLDLVEMNSFVVDSHRYPGLIMVDSRHLRNNPWVINSIARDIAHQWFYNVVGSDPVRETWLNAGLATFLQLGIWMNEEETAEYIEKAHENLAARIQNIMHPELFRNLGYYENWMDYYNVQHLRGMIMFYELQQRMGKELFDVFLRNYYNYFAFGIATSEQMIEMAENIYGESLQQFFNSWIRWRILPPLAQNASN
ncbi:MAG: M1 family metallopeptidase [Defluviitaleaceae bacterium]|nr:M1 family metallopeptidase [Defluviitaleaceae bacterium]